MLTPAEIEDIRAELTAHFDGGQWDYRGGVPDAWLPQLAELNRQLCAVDPDYRVDQISVKHEGVLAFYLSVEHVAPCCKVLYAACPTGTPFDGAIFDEHWETLSCMAATRATERRNAQLEHLAWMAMRDSGSWPMDWH